MKKLYRNLGPAALRVLGLWQYLYMLLGVVRHLPAILFGKKLTALDQWMSQQLSLRVSGYRFTIDCRTVDAMLAEPSYTFGLIREIYIQDCYRQFSHLDAHCRTTIDLGGNRGIFSLLAAHYSERVIYVEAQSVYRRALLHNMQRNGLGNIELLNAYIGGEAALPRGDIPRMTMEEILHDYHIDVVDFCKMDIEGSEFALFQSITCLPRIRTLAAEIHPQFGDPQLIIDKLRQNGFSVSLRDGNLAPMNSPARDRLFYLYACNSRMTM
ncbi:FkbM family methyltransferase [candidate division KSB1 bacterium]|nr:FkbM family methyltransferase [candidate division KSB1 bacterium]